MTVTLSHIAKASGLSLPTVSQILNDKGRFPPQTRQRVLEIARKLEYKPNAIAQAIRSKRFNSVTLLLGTYGRPYFPAGIINGIHNTLARQSISLELAQLPDDKLTDERLVPRILQVLRSDGMLIEYSQHIPDRMIGLIEKNHVPSVWMNSKQLTNCVNIDDAQMARMATEYLLELGHRRISYLSFSPCNHYSRPEREQGYCSAMADAGLSAIVRAAGHRMSSEDERVASYSSIFEGDNRPTAVVTYGSLEASGLLYHAALRGIQVPKDLSIITFHDRKNCEIDRLFTMVQIPMLQMGQEAVKMLLQRIADPKTDLPVKSIQGELLIQDTTAPPFK